MTQLHVIIRACGTIEGDVGVESLETPASPPPLSLSR